MTANSPRPVRIRRLRAFTLIEVLIVVIILGILAAIVIPAFGSVTREALQTSFVADVRIFGDAALVYMAKTGQYLEDSSSGQVPAGFEDYIDEDAWLRGTPIGGVWDFELNSFGFTSGFGVHFNGTGETRDDAYMLEIDDLFDDNGLADGNFQKIAADRYYFILEQ